MSKLPTRGFMDQVTAVLVVPTTVALNFADWPAVSAAGPPTIETLTLAGVFAQAHSVSEVAAIIADIEVTDMNRGFSVIRNCDENSTTPTK